jgi:hypothetical protein
MNDGLVTIATFQIPYHADRTKGMLESAGFQVFLLRNQGIGTLLLDACSTAAARASPASA